MSLWVSSTSNYGFNHKSESKIVGFKSCSVLDTPNLIEFFKTESESNQDLSPNFYTFVFFFKCLNIDQLCKIP